MPSTIDFFAPGDVERAVVRQNLVALDPSGSRWAGVVRHTYDMLYNGQETGRYRWSQLHKTERTHFGTLFEINAQREFSFYDGDALDYSIAGIEVDAKWSQKDGGWMLPPEVVGHLALIATGSDFTASWSLGLVRAAPEHLNMGQNRDAKKTLNAFGRASIDWLWQNAPMTPNILLQLPEETVHEILDPRSGQARILRLLRAAEGRLIYRSAIATVGRQLDPMKRLRENGGARTLLANEGFLVLTGEFHGQLAANFGVPVPDRGQVVAFRVVPADEGGVLIDGRRWRRALSNEVVDTPAPLLSRQAD